MKGKTNKSDKIRKMLADGVSVKEAARRAGTSPNYVYFVKWREAHPVAKPKKPVKKNGAADASKAKVVEKTWKVMVPTSDTVPYTPPENFSPEKEKNNPLDIQVGGRHYKFMEIQPIEFITANDLGFLEGCVIKRICRWRSKDGIEDLEKAKHEIDLLIKMEEEKEIRFL